MRPSYHTFNYWIMLKFLFSKTRNRLSIKRRSSSPCYCEYCNQEIAQKSLFYSLKHKNGTTYFHSSCASEYYKIGRVGYAFSFKASDIVEVTENRAENYKCILSDESLCVGDYVYFFSGNYAKQPVVDSILNDAVLVSEYSKYINNSTKKREFIEKWASVRKEIKRLYSIGEKQNPDHPYSKVPNELHLLEEMYIEVLGFDIVFDLINKNPELAI